MRTHALFGISATGAVACALSCCLLLCSGASQSRTLAPLIEGAPREEPFNGESRSPSVETSLEQHRETLRAIELIRQETAATLAHHADAMTTQFHRMNEVFAAQSQRDLEAVRASNRLVFGVIGVLMILLLATFFLALIPVRAVNRLVAVASASPLPYLVRPHAGSLENIVAPLVAVPVDEPSQAWIENAIEHLENRIFELEQSTVAPASDKHPNREQRTSAPLRLHEHSETPTSSKAAVPPRVALLLGDGQVLGLLPSGVHPIARPRRRFLWYVKKFFGSSLF